MSRNLAVLLIGSLPVLAAAGARGQTMVARMSKAELSVSICTRGPPGGRPTRSGATAMV